MKQRFGEWIRPCPQLQKGEDVSLHWVHYMQLTSGPLPPLDTWTVVFFIQRVVSAIGVREQQQQQ